MATARAALDADAALDRAVGHGRGRGRQLVAVQEREERVGAAGGSRRDPGHRQRAGRRDAGIHRALPARHRRHRPHLPGVRPRLRRRRQPDGVAGHFLHAHGRLGRSQAQHAGAGTAAAAAVHGTAWRDVPSRSPRPAWGRVSASARSTTSSSPATATRTWRGCRSSSWPRWRRTRASCSPTPICGSTSRKSSSRWTGPARPTWASASMPWRARSRPCSAGVPSRATSAMPTSTT